MAAVFLAMGSCEQEAGIEYLPRDIHVGSGIRIETAQQLASIGLTEEYPANEEYYLANDIDLSVLWEEDPENPQETPPVSQTPYVWRSIGSTCRECGGPLLSANTYTHVLPIRCENRDCALFDTAQQPFSGILHGEGKTIAGLKLPGETNTGDYKEAAYLGLFGYTNSAYIHDLTLKIANTAEERAAYNGTAALDASSAIGGVAAFTQGTRIEYITIEADGENAGFYATAALPSDSNTTYIGGAVGRGENTSLKNITSSVLMNIDGPGSLTAGGIAGTASEISNAAVTGNITVAGSGLAIMVAGIGSAGPIKDCTVTLDELTLTTSGTGGNAALAGIGNGTITDCAVDIGLIKIAVGDTAGRGFNVGGIAAASGSGASLSASIERCNVRFDRLEVTADEDTPLANLWVGGIGARVSLSNAKVIDCSVQGGEIAVNLPYSSTGSLNVGGLAGEGRLLRSGIAGPLKINITTGGTGGVSAGGLTGNGTAEYSFIGTKGEHAELTVTRTNTTLVATNTNNANVGGISGNVPLTAVFPFQYNYAFCDVTLITTTATTNAMVTAGQGAGGLAGYVAVTGTPVFAENFAAGSVTLTNNYAGDETTPKVYAGGIAGFTANSANLTLSKNAALNSAVVINGDNSTAPKNWRRIANPGGANTKFSGNITTVIQMPPSYTPENDAVKADGLLVTTPLTADTFLGTEENQLAWNTDVWEWDEASSYPVFK
jgi:hypothetical protein